MTMAVAKARARMTMLGFLAEADSVQASTGAHARSPQAMGMRARLRRMARYVVMVGTLPDPNAIRNPCGWDGEGEQIGSDCAVSMA
jgi:hypothetical protein